MALSYNTDSFRYAVDVLLQRRGMKSISLASSIVTHTPRERVQSYIEMMFRKWLPEGFFDSIIVAVSLQDADCVDCLNRDEVFRELLQDLIGILLYDVLGFKGARA